MLDHTALCLSTGNFIKKRKSEGLGRRTCPALWDARFGVGSLSGLGHYLRSVPNLLDGSLVYPNDRRHIRRRTNPIRTS